MQLTERMPRTAWQQAQPLALEQWPPRKPRRAGRLSGRPTCRIYRARMAWVLEFENGSGGWIEPVHADSGNDDSRLTFPTLAAAIFYAERHGLDYRVVPPPLERSIAVNNRAQ